MRDFLPADKARRERVLSVIRESYRAHGFDEIETPVMEESARLHAGLGGDNEKLAFGVLKRDLTPDDFAAAQSGLDLADLGLRFDLTVPLTRFYASHHSELPSVFRAIQIAPVWRAERPQKGRYRQFVQCDIDIIGEAGTLAEVELITATSATLGALGIEGCAIRINDRRLLASMLSVFGFPVGEHAAVLITIDKLDKLGESGVIAELRARAFPDEPVAALEAFYQRETPAKSFDEAGIRAALPAGIDDTAVHELAALAEAFDPTTRALLEFDPFLVRGMGYYTGTIFEIAHPEFGYALGGGGRYDGMIGRLLGRDVAAVGFSLGFERLVDLVTLRDDNEVDAVALVYGDDVSHGQLVALKSALIAQGKRVRLERKPRNLKPLLAQLAASGFSSVATVSESSTAESLEFRPLA